MKNWETIRVAKKDREAIEKATVFLKQKYPVKDVVLFGSKARGDYDKHSDIDLLVVTHESLHWKEEKAIVEALFDIGMEYDVIFSPLFVTLDEWHGKVFNKFPIYKEINKDGTVVL